MTATKELGLNFATETDKLELGGSARYNYRGNDVTSSGYTENFLTSNSGSSYSNSNSLSKSTSGTVSADFRLEWKPDTMTNIIFRPNFTYGTTSSYSDSESGTFNDNPYNYVSNPNDYLDLSQLAQTDLLTAEDPLEDIRVNTSNNLSSSDGNSLSTESMLQINRKLNSRGRNITFRGRFGYDKSESDQFSSSDTWYFQSDNENDTIRRYITSPTSSYNYRAQLTYSEPLAKSTFLQFSYQFQYKYSESDKSTYDLTLADSGWEMGDMLPANYLSYKDEDQSKYAEYKYYNHDIQIGLRFIRPIYQLNVGVSLQPQHTVLSYKRGDYMTDTTRNVFNFAPNLDLRVRFSQVSQLRVTYRGSSSQPSMENLLPIVDDSNPLSITMGNPGLKPSFTHTLRLFYNTYDQDHQRGIFSHANVQMTQNSISNRREYNETTGGWTSQPDNINGNWSAFGMFGINTALKNKKFTISSFSNANYSNNVGFLSSGETSQKNTTTNLTLNERLNGTYRNNWLEFGLNGTLSYSIEKDKLTPSNNQKPYTYSYGATTTLTAPWNMSLSTNIANQSRRGYTDSSMNRDELIWNAQLSQTFLKGAATISFEMYDILKQQSNISRSLTSSGRSVYEYNGINSYCMLHFIYRLNVFGGKAPGRSDRRGFGGPPPGGFGGGGGRRF